MSLKNKTKTKKEIIKNQIAFAMECCMDEIEKILYREDLDWSLFKPYCVKPDDIPYKTIYLFKRGDDGDDDDDDDKK